MLQDFVLLCHHLERAALDRDESAADIGRSWRHVAVHMWQLRLRMRHHRGLIDLDDPVGGQG